MGKRIVPPDSVMTAARVQEQRLRLFQAQGVIECAALAAESLTAKKRVYLRCALEGVAEILDSVCSELDPSYFDAEVAHG